jgi:hypothetical protein
VRDCKGIRSGKIRVELLKEGEKVTLGELREDGRGLGEIPEGRGRSGVIHGLVRARKREGIWR